MSGLPLLIRLLIQKHFPSIIVYHNPHHSVFRKHIRYLAKRYNFISFEQLVDALINGNIKNLPKYALVISFDDGYRENFLLLDIIRKFYIKPIFFICSEIVGTSKQFWFKLCKNSDKYKRMPPDKRIQLLEQNVEKWNFHEENKRYSLSLKEILTMLPYSTFGSHTCEHNILTICSDKIAWHEIDKSKKKLESDLNMGCHFFCYPNGDYSQREMKMLRNADYLAARTVDWGFIHSKTNKYCLPIVGVVDDDDSLNILSVKISSVIRYCRFFVRGNLKGKKRPIII